MEPTLPSLTQRYSSIAATAATISPRVSQQAVVNRTVSDAGSRDHLAVGMAIAGAAHGRHFTSYTTSRMEQHTSLQKRSDHRRHSHDSGLAPAQLGSEPNLGSLLKPPCMVPKPPLQNVCNTVQDKDRSAFRRRNSADFLRATGFTASTLLMAHKNIAEGDTAKLRRTT
jgi:hypothetical protein